MFNLWRQKTCGCPTSFEVMTHGRRRASLRQPVVFMTNIKAYARRPQGDRTVSLESLENVTWSAVVEDRFLCRHVGSNFIPTATLPTALVQKYWTSVYGMMMNHTFLRSNVHNPWTKFKPPLWIQAKMSTDCGANAVSYPCRYLSFHSTNLH